MNHWVTERMGGRCTQSQNQCDKVRRAKYYRKVISLTSPRCLERYRLRVKVGTSVRRAYPRLTRYNRTGKMVACGGHTRSGMDFPLARDDCTAVGWLCMYVCMYRE